MNVSIGPQIKALRIRYGRTQEMIAQDLGITSQAISKWECGSSAPDISMLPKLAKYFGVRIEDLFALPDEIRMERIQNMLWDVRYLKPEDVDNERQLILK